MITQSHIDQLVTMAGTGFNWAGTRSSKPSSGVAKPIRVGLFDFIRDYANGYCAFCGMESTTGEICHIVSGGPKRCGYVPGNLAFGCRTCNELDAQSGPVVTLASITRPDLVPIAWPDSDALAWRGTLALAHAEHERRQKRSRRGL